MLLNLIFSFTEKRAARPVLHCLCGQRPYPDDVHGLARLLRQVRLHEQQVHQHRLSPRHHHRRVHLRHVHVVLLLAPGQSGQWRISVFYRVIHLVR